MARAPKWDWYKRYPATFIRGVRGMGPDAIGAYAVILDLIYEDEDSCPNDPRWLGGLLGCSGRKAAALIQRLVDHGKLSIREDGRLVNTRASTELAARDLDHRKSLEPGVKPPRISDETNSKPSRSVEDNEVTSAKINDLLEVPHPTSREEKNRIDKKEDTSSLRSEGNPPKPKGSKPSSKFEVPDWVPAEPWEQFVAMRNKIRAPLTAHAAKLAVGDLDGLRRNGHDPMAVLDQSTKNAWRGLFAPKVDQHRNGKNGKPNGLDTTLAVAASLIGEFRSQGGTDRDDLFEAGPPLLEARHVRRAN